jgi:hypothetical protein
MRGKSPKISLGANSRCYNKKPIERHFLGTTTELATYFEQNGPGLIRQTLMAELASFCGVHAAMARVVVLAGKPFVQVEALLLLGASLKQIKLAEFHDLGRFSIMRKHAVLGALKRK